MNDLKTAAQKALTFIERLGSHPIADSCTARNLAEVLRSALSAQEAAEPAKPIGVEAVATVKMRDGEPVVDWLIEGGAYAAAEDGEAVLLIAHESITDDDGFGVVYTAPVAAASKPEYNNAMRAWLGAVGELFVAMGRPDLPDEMPVQAIADIIHEAAKRIAAPVSVPAGFRMVPVEPTPEMLAHAERTLPGAFSIGDEYRAMLAAAPGATPAASPSTTVAPEAYAVDAVAWESFVRDWGRYVSGNLSMPFSALREGIAAVIDSAAPQPAQPAQCQICKWPLSAHDTGEPCEPPAPAAGDGQEWCYVIECRDGFVPNVKGPFNRQFTESTLREFAAYRPSYLMVVRSTGWPEVSSGVEWIDMHGDKRRGRLATAAPAPVPSPDAGEREAFEAEMRCEEEWGHRSLKRAGAGYVNAWVQFGWDVWQARAARSQSRQPLTDEQAHLLYLKLSEKMATGDELNNPYAMFLDILRDIERAQGIAAPGGED